MSDHELNAAFPNGLIVAPNGRGKGVGTLSKTVCPYCEGAGVCAAGADVTDTLGPMTLDCSGCDGTGYIQC